MNRKMSEWEKTVRKRLIDLNMSFTDLAKQLGISRVYLHDIVTSSRTTPSKIGEINRILGIANGSDCQN